MCGQDRTLSDPSILFALPLRIYAYRTTFVGGQSHAVTSSAGFLLHPENPAQSLLGGPHGI